MSTAAQQAHAAGLPGLAYITAQTGIGRSTLDLWSKSKPRLFGIVLAGCKVGCKSTTTTAPKRAKKVNA